MKFETMNPLRKNRYCHIKPCISNTKLISDHGTKLQHWKIICIIIKYNSESVKTEEADFASNRKKFTYTQKIEITRTRKNLKTHTIHTNNPTRNKACILKNSLNNRQIRNVVRSNTYRVNRSEKTPLFCRESATVRQYCEQKRVMMMYDDKVDTDDNNNDYSDDNYNRAILTGVKNR